MSLVVLLSPLFVLTWTFTPATGVNSALSSSQYALPKQQMQNDSNENLTMHLTYGQSSGDDKTALHLAQPILEQQPATVDEIYGHFGLASQTDNAASNKQTNTVVLYKIDFGADFHEANPRNKTSQWKWFNSHVKDLLPSDGAALVRQSPTSPAANRVPSNESYVEFISEPFSKHFSQQDRNRSYFEGAMYSKKVFHIEDSKQRILFRTKFACRITSATDHPFPAALVTNPCDDPR